MPNLFSRLFGGHDEKPSPETVPLVPATEQMHPSFYRQQGRVRELLDHAVPDYMDYVQLAVRLMAQQAESSGEQFNYDKDKADHYTRRIEAIHAGRVTDPSVEELRLIASAFTDRPGECVESDEICKAVCSQIDFSKSLLNQSRIDFEKSVLHQPNQSTTEVSPDVQILSTKTFVSDKNLSPDDQRAIIEALKRKQGGNLTEADLPPGMHISTESPKDVPSRDVMEELLKHKSLEDITDADLPPGMHIIKYNEPSEAPSEDEGD